VSVIRDVEDLSPITLRSSKLAYKDPQISKISLSTFVLATLRSCPPFLDE